MVKAISAAAMKELLLEGSVWFGAERKSFAPVEKVCARFGVGEIDGALLHGGFPRGHVHEFSLALAEKERRCGEWNAPLSLVSLLLRDLLLQSVGQREFAPPIVWIGRKCFPTAHLLEKVFLSEEVRDAGWHWSTHCVFVDASTKKERLWSALEALRSQAVLAAVVDGSRLDFVGTRRLQLAAKKGNSLGIIIRPEKELSSRSAARTKWSVATLPTVGSSPRWRMKLLYSPGLLTAQTWNIEWNEDDAKKISLTLLPDVDGGSVEPVAGPIEHNEEQRRA